MCGSKSRVSTKYLDWTLEECLPVHDCMCGESTFLGNDINAADIPEESWTSSKALLEFRHKITCKSAIETQVHTFL